MNTIEVMKQALDAIGTDDISVEDYNAIITNLRAAIADMERVEPVGWYDPELNIADVRKAFDTDIPLYTHPQDRDSIIEECASICENGFSHYDTDCGLDLCAAEIRALKGKK